MNFSEDSDPFNGIGLENLRGYDPQITCHVLDALRTGRDLLGYIGRCIGSYSTSLAA
jgi:hypothetical protein